MLKKKKQLIDMHSKIMVALGVSLKHRDLADYFSLEWGFITGEFDDEELKRLVDPKTPGTLEDKIRLFLIYFMAKPNADSEMLAEFEKLIRTLPNSGKYFKGLS